MSKLTKRLSLSLAAAAALAALVLPASASAAVSLGVEATHAPATVHRGDGYLTYSIAVKNNGDTATSAPTNLHLGLPAGTLFEGWVSGAGWSCVLSAATCTNPDPAGPGGSFPVLTVAVLLDPEAMPETVTATFTAFGGGASSPGIGQESFALGTPLSFGLKPGSFVAGACGEAPVLAPPSTAACLAGELGDPSTQAGGHPFAANTSFAFNTKNVSPNGESGSSEFPFENLRDGAVNLPPGFVANPTVVAGGCTIQDVELSNCPPRFAVGLAEVALNPGFSAGQNTPIYKIQTEEGYPAAFGIRPVPLSGVTVVLRAKVRPGDSTATAFVPTPPQIPAVERVKYFTFCSYGAKTNRSPEGRYTSPGCKKPTDPGALSVPFLTNPTRCNGEEDVTSINVASYQDPGAFDPDGFPDLSDPDWKSYEATSPALTGCNQLPFEPSFQSRPTTTVADAPSGLEFDLTLPQDGLVEPEGIATAHLKQATVALPQGMTLNPSAATGLEACSTEQVGLVELNHPGPFPVRFDGSEASCPNGSKVGTVQVTSPLIDETVLGSVYLAQQDDPVTTAPGVENPFDSTLALYIVLRNEEIGLSAKLAGEVKADPVTGQLTTTFAQNPQLPFDHLQLKIAEGARASLRTPPTCGTKATTAELTSWSAQTPVASLTDSFQTTTAPGVDPGPCATDPSQLPNAPRLHAGTVSAKAGSYSPFVLRLAREDGSQEIKGLNATLPPGLTGRLAGVPYCPEAGIAQAIARDKPRQGALEKSSPSCPAASEVGTVEVSAGAGPTPFRTSARAYLAGPYKGAPLSMVVIAPAVAGPFDLGVVVVRNALHVDPVTAQVRVASDPIPTILEGIPLDVRSIEVKVDRPQFTLNPTSCEPMSIGVSALGLSSVASLTNRFQVGECAALKFKPRLKLRLQGSPKRAEYQRLTATVTYPKKGAYANIARTAVTFPHSIFLAQEHIRTVCTRVQFAADACPKGSIYGEAEAETPLLDEPLKGPVYLRSSDNLLPDVVVALRGPDSQPIEVELAGRVDSKNKGIRNRFELVPDAPVSKFTLRMFGGKKSLLVNSRNLCKGPKQRATARFVAHNGRRHDFRPVVRNDCKKGKGGTKGRKGGK